jgi:ABC-type Fe3+-hydroxamate transport system substrate-binding protein
MPKRIVSLVPSWTHTLCELGLQEQVVGCTNFCVKPASLHKTATLIGGTKDPDVDAILALNPSHVIVNEEENKTEHIKALAAKVPVARTFARKIGDVSGELVDLGVFLGEEKPFNQLAALISEAITGLGSHPERSLKTFLYFIWREPYMIAGEDSYISSLLGLLGWKNAYQGDGRYPEVSIDEISRFNSDVILLSTEPYPFRQRDGDRLRKELDNTELPPIYKFDGQLGSWYGALTLEAIREIKKWLDQDPTTLMKPL